MRKSILSVLLGALLAVPAARAEEAPKAQKSTLRTWFEHLKQGLAESSLKRSYQKRRVTAVAAVRGAPQDAADPDKPSWKGGAGSKKTAALRAERAEFGKAVDLILEGKSDEGLAALEAFEKAHPQSSLLPDVREARAKTLELKAEAAPEADKKP